MPPDLNRIFDVLVVGGGNAGLSAAITARRLGMEVLIIESAPEEFRAGNSRHTMSMMVAHPAPTEYLTGSYTEDDYYKDLMRVTGGKSDEKLARIFVQGSVQVPAWLQSNGIRGFFHEDYPEFATRNQFLMLGGGKAMMNWYYRTAQHLGIHVVYETEGLEINLKDGEFHSLTVQSQKKSFPIRAKSLIVASGGFQANRAWLKEIWGEVADNFIIRGSGYNQGTMLKQLLKLGAASVGDPKACHAVALDARAPKVDGGIVTRNEVIPYGICVNKLGKRFYDEGEDFWIKRYAIWGAAIARQPDQLAFAITDHAFMSVPRTQIRFSGIYPAIQANSISELAVALGIDPVELSQTVEKFNKSIQPGTPDVFSLDNCKTMGLEPPKSHWAQPISKPPFYGFPLRPGITFTYLGVKVNENAQVMLADGKPIRNIYAAGEIMAGNILTSGYLGGVGLVIGAVFGQIAGREASKHAAV